jgi:hypothetical protein
MPGLLFLLLSTVVATRPAAAGFGTCPASQAEMRNAGVATLEASLFDSSTTDATGVYHVRYNLPQGRVFAAQPGCLCGAWVEAADLFDVTGVPAGTSVTLTAILTMDGTVSTPGCPGQCAGSVDCRISSGVVQDAKYQQVIINLGSMDVHDVASIPVTFVAGTPVEIRYYVHGQRSVGGNHATTTTGLLSFSGLPNGVVVVSCQGFTAAATTAARPMNWGALKAIYR